ncbi:MAG TPA: hypothetical protein VKY65_12550 [Alphaproteobacteria bacterium]|nr:hypothetical protein [Alphaproteobacteria bacterium]
MTDISISGRSPERRDAGFRGVADGLGLAAAPIFAIMALLTGVSGGGQPDLLCSAAQDVLPLHGMVPMYLLMGVFHAAPWLKLMASRMRRHPPGSNI